jgi:hypothetical protein
VQGPDDSLGDIDKECKRGERAHRREVPARTKPEQQRPDEKENQGSERDEEVGQERRETNADQRRQIRGPARGQCEEVVVSDEEDAFHECDRR